MGKKKFLSDIMSRATENGVTVKIEDSKFIYDDGVPCAGYFSCDRKILAAAKKGKVADYLGLMAHESSHMDQWLDDSDFWYRCGPGYDAFFEWLEDKNVTSNKKLDKSVQDIILIEKDCEIRAIEKIKKYNLNINLDKYKRKSNAYLFSILFFREHRIWIPKLYSDKEVWSLSPIKFQKEYKEIPKGLKKAFNKKMREYIKKNRSDDHTNEC